MKPTFFKTPAELRRWLARHHAKAPELVVGFWKRGTGKPSITWPELVDEVLCFGWIDGVRHSIDEESYTIRITPRRRGSRWSAINIRRVGGLTKAGRMKPAGRKVFEERGAAHQEGYSYARLQGVLAPGYRKKLAANARAAAFFDSQPPWYRRIAAYYVMSAKKEETRERRLAILIADSARGRRIGLLGQTKSKRG